MLIVGLLTLVTLAAFEAMAVAATMPVVAEALDSVRNYSLAFSLFLTTSLLGNVVGGSWADTRGPLQPTMAGVVGFLAGLVVCGAATSFPLLLVGRAVSGIGAGLFVVSLYVALALGYDEADRPRVFGYLSAAWVVPALVGPAIAGWLTDQFTWRLVFLGVVPVGLVAAAVLWGPLKAISRPGEERDSTSGARVVAGVVLAGGAAGAQWAAQHLGDGGLWVWLVALAGVVAVLGSLPRLVPAGTLVARRGLPAVIMLRGLFTASFFAGEAFVPLALTQERGFSVTQAGVSLSLASVAWAVAAWVQGRNPHWQPSRLIAVGAGCIVVSLVGLAVVFVTHGSGWLVLPMWAVGGFGMGISQPAISVAMLALAPEGEQGKASSALTLLDALGTVASLGVVGAVFAALHSSDDAGLFTGIWLALAVIAGFAGVVALRRVPAMPRVGD